jgi:von Willebrand factor type A domain-containing protein
MMLRAVTSMKQFREFGMILVPIVAMALIGAACSHEQVRLIAGGPAPGSGPEFAAESEQPMTEVQAPIEQPVKHNTKGLDLVLIIPRSGTPRATVNEIKGKLTQLVESIHRFVPIARVGIVIYDAKPEEVATVSLTDSAPTAIQSIAAITAERSTPENDNIRAAARAAIGPMGWNPNAKRIIVLVVDRAIETNEAAGLVEVARKFRATGGIFDAVDALAQSESEPQSQKTTHETLRAIAAAGGGTVKALRKEKPTPKRPADSISPRADIAQ